MFSSFISPFLFSFLSPFLPPFPPYFVKNVPNPLKEPEFSSKMVDYRAEAKKV